MNPNRIFRCLTGHLLYTFLVCHWMTFFLLLSSCTSLKPNGVESAALLRPSSPNNYANKEKATNAKRRKAEDKMAMIFVAIVTGFLICNFPRILLNFHEVIVFDQAMACGRIGKRYKNFFHVVRHTKYKTYTAKCLVGYIFELWSRIFKLKSHNQNVAFRRYEKAFGVRIWQGLKEKKKTRTLQSRIVTYFVI